MVELLLAFLKSAARAAAKGVGAVGKATIKGAKLGLEKNPLLQALGMQGDQSNTKEALKGTAFDIDKYSSTPSTQPPSWQAPQIPPSYSPLASSLQAPQSMGSTINRPSIPSQYLNIGQQSPQAQPTSRGSFLGGLKEGFLGMPQTGESVPYYAGKLIPDIVRSKMGVSTAGEEARSKKLLQAYGLKEYTPEFKTDLQYSLKRLPTLNEDQKVLLYQQMAAEYPDKTNELKRIFFPQSQEIDILKQLIASEFSSGY